MRIPLLLATAIVIMVMVPASYWRPPLNDGVYEGFDPGLLYVGNLLDPESSLGVEVSRNEITLLGTNRSQPIVHLVTTPMSFAVQLDVRVGESGYFGVPLRVGIWSPRTLTGHFLVFHPPPTRLITSETFTRESHRDPIRDLSTRSTSLGKYSEGTVYRLVVSVDKKAGGISLQLTANDTSPMGNPYLNLTGGPSRADYSDVISDAIVVRENAIYRYGGTVRVVSGSDSYKISLAWFDASNRFISFAGTWRNVRELHGWTRKEFATRAPRGARHARFLLGSGDGTKISFADLYFRREGELPRNLLRNGDFREGATAWSYVRRPNLDLDIIKPLTRVSSSITRDELPELFPHHRLPLSLSASSSAEGGVAVVSFTNYVLTLPHQAWQVDRVSDLRAKSLLYILWLLSAVAIGINLLQLRNPQRGSLHLATRLVSPGVVSSQIFMNLILWGGFLTVNTLLYGLGNHPFDMLSAKIWAYVSMKYGPTELYTLPNTVTLAKVWGGAPYHEAIFPYGPTMGILFGIAGWIFKLLLGGTTTPASDTFRLEFIVKTISTLFALAGAAIIRTLQRDELQNDRECALVTLLFLANPALVFITSVWGQTQTWSLFFALAAVWAIQRGHPLPAWLLLILTALTRPQLLVVVPILALFALRSWSWKRNLQSISWAITITYVLAFPFLVDLSPNMPITYLRNLLFLQVAGGNEPELTTVSLDAYSLWPLVTAVLGKATGLSRFTYPAFAPVTAGLTYGQLANILSAVFLLLILCLMATWRGKLLRKDLQLLLALGVTGFLMLKTGLAGMHFVIALPFLVLTYSAAPRLVFVAMIGSWTITTTVAVLASFGYSVLGVPWLSPRLQGSNNPLIASMMALHASDWFITLACLANLSVVMAIGYLITARWLPGFTRALPRRT